MFTCTQAQLFLNMRKAVIATLLFCFPSSICAYGDDNGLSGYDAFGNFTSFQQQLPQRQRNDIPKYFPKIASRQDFERRKYYELVNKYFSNMIRFFESRIYIAFDSSVVSVFNQRLNEYDKNFGTSLYYSKDRFWPTYVELLSIINEQFIWSAARVHLVKNYETIATIVQTYQNPYLSGEGEQYFQHDLVFLNPKLIKNPPKAGDLLLLPPKTLTSSPAYFVPISHNQSLQLPFVASIPLRKGRSFIEYAENDITLASSGRALNDALSKKTPARSGSLILRQSAATDSTAPTK